MVTRTIGQSHLVGEIHPPNSKSISHRALMFSSLSDSPVEIMGLLQSEDVMATLSVLQQLGAEIIQTGDNISVNRSIDRSHDKTLQLDCKNSGTTLRLMMGIVAALKGEYSLFGDQSLNSRPVDLLSKAIRKLGKSVVDTDGTPPVTISGMLDNGDLHTSIKGNISSQYISALMILGAIREEGTLSLDLLPPVVSKPYFQLTQQMLTDFGVQIQSNENSFNITGRDQLQAKNIEIPIDFSSAAFFIAAAAVPGNSVRFRGFVGNYIQSDYKIMEIIKQMGARVTEIKSDSDTVIEIQSDEFYGTEINLCDSPDIFPILATVATQADGTTRLYGAEHLHFKESNRIKVMCDILRYLGANVTPTKDGAIVKKSKLIGGISIDPSNDHRIAMASAIAGTFCEKPVDIINAGCVGVSYPNFFDDLDLMMGR